MVRLSTRTELTSVAQDDYVPIYDVSTGEIKRVTQKNLVGIPDNGWVATGETWTYSSWTSGTGIGVITVPTGAQSKYYVGMRVRFSQTTGGTKYGEIVAVPSNTTISVYLLDGASLANETITSPVYSSDYAPSGYDTTAVFAGSASNVWWEELGRTTLGSAGDTITVSSFRARKYLTIIFSGTSTGGSISPAVVFNSDTTNSYAQRYCDNNGADTTSVNRANLACDSAGAAALPTYVELRVVNVAAQEKLARGFGANTGTAGAANAPNKRDIEGKWVNTSAQITTVTVTNLGTGDFAIGSEVVVLGRD